MMSRSIASGFLLIAAAMLQCKASMASDCPRNLEADTAPGAAVIALLPCLREPDPLLRDDLGYTRIAELLRANNIDPAVVREARDQLLAMLAAPDADGFARPFAALVLAEVARVDRVSLFLSAEERTELVSAATSYVRSVRDYRGHSDTDGWRHGVAHGADFLLQLVLNPQLDEQHVMPIVAAALSQVRPSGGHAYIYGESRRLARPVLFAAQRNVISPEEWSALFDPLAAPPGESWDAAFRSTNDLAALHNSRAFLLAVYASVAETERAEFSGLRDAARTALQDLP